MSKTMDSSHGKMKVRKEDFLQDPNNQISRKLRQLYDSVQDEQIPDRFLDLLEKLDQAEASANSKPKAE